MSNKSKDGRKHSRRGRRSQIRKARTSYNLFLMIVNGKCDGPIGADNRDDRMNQGAFMSRSHDGLDEAEVRANPDV